MFGEKFIEKRIEGNKIIREFEYRKFDYDYEEIAMDLNDHVTDDPEELSCNGVYLDYEDFHSIDCDMALEWIEGLLQEDEGMYYNILKKHIKPLKKAKGFIIYFRHTDDLYKEDFNKH